MMLNSVLLPQPEWPTTHTNSPFSTPKLTSSKTTSSAAPLPCAGWRLARRSTYKKGSRVIPSSSVSGFVAHAPPRAGQQEIERHAHDANQQYGKDHGGQIEIVPLVPDVVADARAAHE